MTTPDLTSSASIDVAAVEREPPPRRRTRYLFIALGVTVYAIAVALIGWRKVGGALAGADVVLVGFAAMLTGAGAALRLWKWRRALGADRHAIGIFFLSRSGGVWSPARVGEFLPLLWRRHRNSRVAAWILFDRVLEVLVTLLLGLIGLAIIRLVPTPALVAIVALISGCAIGGVYALTRADWLARLSTRFAEPSRLRAALTAVAGTSGEFRAYFARSAGLAAITVLAKTIDLYAVVLIFRALQAPVGLALVAASKCALAIVSYLPITPMTTGLPHTVQGLVMHESAGIQPEIIAASIAIEAGIMMAVFSVMALAAARAIRDAAL